jgi:hypothetical protein
MTGRLHQRLCALERRADLLAGWRGRPASECPDWVLEAFAGEHEGWPPGYIPGDAELRMFLARSHEDALAELDAAPTGEESGAP